MATAQELPLNGLRILVVDDELLIADMIADVVRDAGGEIIGPATSLEVGEALARSEALDGAFLDVNLAGKASYPIAQTLMRRDIPLAFLTGYSGVSIPEMFRRCPSVSKPFQFDELVLLAGRYFTKQAR